nr:MAG TPA: Neurotrypsin [Caudoviricetes sp.]
MLGRPRLFVLRSRRPRGHHRLTPHNFCERHPAKWRGAFCYTRKEP